MTCLAPPLLITTKCLTWNYPDGHRCNRCGEYRPEEQNSRIYQNQGGYTEDGAEDEKTEVDEFGRAMKKSSEKKSVPEWPPCFDSAGSAFVFDSRSGMFYEGVSDFFYDPKSKLYYGNKKGTYYKYNSDITPPFEPVQKINSQSTGNSNTMDPVPILDPSRPEYGVEGSKKSIMIKLKTKTLKSSKPKQEATPLETSNATLTATNPRVHKQHELNIDKWSDRQVEKRIEDRKFQRTAKGEPMCALCRRKFPTVEKLLHHEQVSQLHKDNLAKAATTRNENAQYVDRAEQRRSMYGPEVPLLATKAIHAEHAAIQAAAAVQTDETPPVVETLDSETNIGNQLLRKMGWKEGNSLGGRSDAPAAASELIKDWERIEKLADQGGKHDRSARGGGGVGAP